MTPEMKSMLARHEGLRLKPYKDSVGKLTIGIGRNLDDVGVSDDEVDLMFNNDISRAEMEVAKYFPWTVGLDSVRRDVLVNMCFNLGPKGLSKFTKFLTAMVGGDYLTASKEMLDSLWAKQVGKRAIELSQIVLKGKEE